MRLDRSTTREYFELDFGEYRFTHYPTGDTCLRHQWMVGRQSNKWTEKLTDFLTRHPEASIIVNSRGDIIDDANSFPHRGGEYKVGDVVLLNLKIDGDDWGPCAKTIIERRETEGDQFFEPHPYFVLDDGSELFWNESRNGWIAWRPEPYEEFGRARAPLEGEVVQTLDQMRQDMLSMNGRRY